MQDDNHALQEKLRALEDTFRQKLPARIAEIAHALQQLVQDVANREALTALHRYLHTMAGSAGTFGFDELGAQARLFEARMRPCLEGAAWPTDELRAYVRDVQAYFTAALADLGQTVARTSAVHEEAPGQGNGSGLIYLAGHDTAQTQAITAQLEQFGYEVLGIGAPGALAAALATRRPDVLVVELALPDESGQGAEQIAQIQRIGVFRVPTIFVARSSSFEARLLAVRANGDGYFTKPVDVAALTERIDAILQKNERSGYRILIIDDDSVTAEYYSAILGNAGMEVRVLNEPAQILNVMSDFRPELLLLDVYMPACSGVEISKIIRQDNSYLDIPIVFLSSETDPGKQLEAVRAGADDFITKPVAPEFLVSSLATRAERYRALRALIMRDGLTKLYNHSAIKEQLATEISMAKRSQAPLALAMIDLDNFKKVNDSYGHPVGDQVLRTLARLLRQRLRRSDLIGRYGGEEFAVIFPGTSAITAHKVLDQVRLAFSKISHHADRAEFSVSFSAGVADLETSTDADELIDAADTAMYRSKQEGRNRITQA